MGGEKGHESIQNCSRQSREPVGKGIEKECGEKRAGSAMRGSQIGKRRTLKELERPKRIKKFERRRN